MLGNKNIKYLGFGSPLMDMIADVNEEIIKKYNIELDTTIHSKMTESPIFSAIEKECSVTYVPGGCSYNAMRWMMNEQGKETTGLLGSVGDDFYGQLYSSLLEAEGIIPIFECFKVNNTGVCCVACFNRDRAHITDLGASTLVSKEFADGILDELKNTELIYTELFILKHRKNIVYMLATFAENERRTFGFNLPSFYFIETFLEDIKNLFEYADIVFANAAEASFFGNLLGIKECEDLGELCKILAKFPKKNMNKRRVIVITCGPNPAFAAEYDFIEQNISFYGVYSPVPVEENKIIDTNGAGDAFAGGFLSQLTKKKPLEECMKAGHWAASIIIQERGCQIPVGLYYDEQ